MDDLADEHDLPPQRPKRKGGPGEEDAPRSQRAKHAETVDDGEIFLTR